MKKLISVFLIIFLFLFNTKNLFAFDPTEQENNIYGMGVINHSDLTDVSNLVNTNGGDWGYVKVVITENERNKEVWQKFMDECRKLHLIPIIRIATNFDGKNWEIPEVNEIDSWVNFFNSLNWVIENRYVVIGNEPNHAKEWGGKIDPEGYALYLKTFSEKLNNSNSDYFILNAGFDRSASNSKNTLDEEKYLREMQKAVPNIFDYIEGWNSHSYPNPGFSGSKNGIGRKSIKGYEWELNLLKLFKVTKDYPVFILETGWTRNYKNEELITNNMKYAFSEIWGRDKRVIAVTPFILNYTEEPFYEFSWKNKDGNYFKIYSEIQNLSKTKGEPIQKISGEILFKFLNPLSTSSNYKKGYTLVRNTGQNVWNKNNVSLVSDSNKFNIENVELNNINPFSTGLVAYTIKFPEKPDSYQLNIGFYVNETKIGDAYGGKIVTIKNSNERKGLIQELLELIK